MIETVECAGCGSVHEYVFKFGEPRPRCPDCGAMILRGVPPVHYKGSGFTTVNHVPDMKKRLKKEREQKREEDAIQSKES